MKYPVAGKHFHDLQYDRLIKCDAGHLLKDQRFKIIRISKPMKGLVTIDAEHISYLAQDLSLKPDIPFSGNASVALATWAASMVDEHPFTTFSDILTTGQGKWTLSDTENARKALGGMSGSILDTYGGEYRFDNYHVGLYAQRGNDSGALIAYGRNLTELTQEEAIDSTYTSVYPYSIYTDDDENEITVTLPEYFVDSEHVENFARRKILKVDFSEDEITTVSALRSRAESYITSNNIGVPKVNLKLKFVDLAKALNSENQQAVEAIGLCDLVTVYFEKFDIQTKAKIIRVIWNVLLDQYDEIEVGEARTSLSKSIDSTIDDKVERVDKRVTRVQIAANGKNKVYRSLVEPTAGTKGDLWYRPVGDGEVEMHIHDGSMFVLEAFSADALGGTVNFANVNGINFNANNIVTGSLDTHFVQIVGEENLFFWDGAMLKAINPADVTKFVELTSNGLYIARGALTIERPDGALSVSNGLLQNDFSLQPTNPTFRNKPTVSEVGVYWATTETDPQNCEAYFFAHKSRYLKMMVVAHDLGSGKGSRIGIYEVGGGGATLAQTAVYGETDATSASTVLTVDLGVPTGDQRGVYVRLNTTVGGEARGRIVKAWLEQ
ncbi:phage tail protein [Planococcus sp. A6]|uniref:phage tail spike protein n=1 Tax=Planococcus sp. A6 TaxID=2992760 RepID=UPI00237B3815|nr:phage tail spike protein [Planococcus sp. A6]MDE0582246.1 phage tail protein [Planococcus sp. A6]